MDLLNDLFIFEMANSHQGSVEHGLDIIRAMGKIARENNVKAAVKLQYRELETFIHKDFKGRQDIKHIKRFEETQLTEEDFDVLVQAIKDEGMVTMSTPFDETGVNWCLNQGIDIIKIASCSSMDWPLLERAAETGKTLIISLGGKTIPDIDKIYNFFTHRNCKFAFMHCIAEYPVPNEHIQLDFIDRLRKRYSKIPIGYSGHENPDDMTVPMLAVAKGAKIFERHVGLPTETISLNAYSMNPEQASKWVQAVLKAKEICMLKKEGERYISQEEVDSLHSLMRGVYARTNLKKGDILRKEDVYFAMPCQENQMSCEEFMEGMILERSYDEDEPLYEKRVIKDSNIARSVIHDAKGLLYEAGIALGNEFEVELSHHYGMRNFRQFGAVIISIINRKYCKKLIIVLPNQKHPSHMHKIKEETFQILYGELDCIVGNDTKHLEAGDILTIYPHVMHSFSSQTGVVFEEISTTHIVGDSYYEDSAISKMDPMERKTIIENW